MTARRDLRDDLRTASSTVDPQGGRAGTTSCLERRSSDEYAEWLLALTAPELLPHLDGR